MEKFLAAERERDCDERQEHFRYIGSNNGDGKRMYVHATLGTNFLER